MHLRIEYRHDPESRNWSFCVPRLGIVGAADTREEAERAAVEAISFALEDESELAEPDDGEVRYLELAVRR
jgi:predicted RNase H-like HicB family nuclease